RSHRNYQRSRRAAWLPIHRLNPCTTRKLCSDTALRIRVRTTGRHSLPTPADSRSEFSCRRQGAVRMRLATKSDLKVDISLETSERGVAGIPIRRLVRDSAAHHREQHFRLVDLVRIDVENVLRQYDQVGHFSRLKGAFSFFPVSGECSA